MRGSKILIVIGNEREIGIIYIYIYIYIYNVISILP